MTMTLTTLPNAFLTAPFADYAFMRRALAACVILALGGVPLGLFMTLRRMTLAGDALSHAILPGVALAFLAFGFSLWAMTAGGMLAGVIVALLATALTRMTRLKEDAAFTLLYLLALAVGVLLISRKGNNLDLMHLLFGNLLAIRPESLWLIAAATSLALLALAILYRRLVMDCFDPEFLQACAARQSRNGKPALAWANALFFAVVMIDLIAAFQALGTLMALGLMLLPVFTARFWTQRLETIAALGIVTAIFSAWTGLLASYYFNLPAGSCITLVAGTLTLLSAILGRYGSMRRQRK